MAVFALQFPHEEITPAQRLRKMLTTCENKADFSTWAGDWLAHAHQVPVEDARDLVKAAVAVSKRLRTL